MDQHEDRLLGTTLVLACQRTDCRETHAISVHVEPGQIAASAMGVAETVTEDWPEGWGWDYADVNSVLHCPEHRS